MSKQQKKKTKEIEYAVKYLHETKRLSSTDISLELGVSEAMVEGIINQPKDETPRQESKSQNMMIRKTAAKQINNVSVMTEAASQINDEAVKNFGRTQSRTSKNAIFRPNG